MNIAFIPARGGSKSIPLKNIKIFCGRPLIHWNLLALQNSKSIDRIIVATDSAEIKTVVDALLFNKVEVYDRDAVNATDTASTESVMLEFLDKHPLMDEDLFFLVQATSPFTQSEDFDRALQEMKRQHADSLLTCIRSKRFFWGNNGVPLNYDYMHRPRRQNFQGLLMENGAFYINSVGNIKKFQNRLSGKIAVYVMPDFTSIEIDEVDDWFIAETLMFRHVLKTNKKAIKLLLTDVDGTLTDAGMYYGSCGEELKKFNTHDGKGFELLRDAGIKIGILTGEATPIVEKRAKKLNVDFFYQSVSAEGKLKAAQEICSQENITLEEVAYVGDDVNCQLLLSRVGLPACPANAVDAVKNIPGILLLSKRGGEGAVREFCDYIATNNIF